MQLKDLRIKTKLFLLIGLITAVTVALATLGITRLTGMNASLVLVDEVGDRQVLGARMNQNLIIINRSEYRMAADPSADTVASATEVNLSNRKIFEDRLGQIRATASTEEAQMLNHVKETYDIYVRG